MVKGLFNKLKDKEGNDSSSKSEEVPDELPPLVEDEIQKSSAEEKKEEPAPAVKEEPRKEKQTEAVVEPPKEAFAEPVKESRKPSEVQKPAESQEKETFSTPSALGDLESLKKSASPKKVMEASKPILSQPDDTKVGFFSTLYSITKDQGVNKNILNKDLLDGMKSFHDHEKKEAAEEHYFKITKDKIKEKIHYKLVELKDVEESWKKISELISQYQQRLNDEEEKIKIKSEELKVLIKKLSFFNPVEPENRFKTMDGVEVKSPFELLNTIKIMDDNVFNHHVNEHRNDFESWIKDIDKDTAKKMHKAITKDEIIAILESGCRGELD